MNNSKKPINLLPLNSLKKTGEVDHADWNYRPFLGYIQRKRFELCVQLFNNYHFENLLIVGYGSGVFIPTLAEYSTNIYGIDIHNHIDDIKKVLSAYSIQANLLSASAHNMPIPDNFFDAIVSISAMEFFNDLENSCLEIKRVIKKVGCLFVITPGYSKFVDLGLKILTGKSADVDFEDRRQKVIPTLMKYFEVKEKLYFPKYSFIKLYTALRLAPL